MFKHLIWISAMFIAGCAALFSVTGIATLYAGALVPVAIMAASLEAGKLISASYLYRYWLLTPKVLRTYLISGVTVLMLITSLGIYAFLTSAYAKVATEPKRLMNEIAVIDSKQQSLNSSIDRYQVDITGLDARLAEAQQAELTERQAAQIFGGTTRTTTALRTEINTQSEETRSRLELAIQQRDSLETEKLNRRNQINDDSKIGTFVYIAEAFDVSLDKIVKYFTLIIVFVFDPLAVTLVLAYNIIVVSEKGRPKIKIREPEEILDEVLEEVKDEEEEDVIVQESVPEIQEEEFRPSRMSLLKALKDKITPSPRETPYYAHPDYDWNTDDRWKTDDRAKYYFRQMRKIDS